MTDSSAKLEKQIGIIFKNKKLLKNVFIHRSYLNEHKNLDLVSNEKLEFLGDSVLSLITSVYLYKKYPALSEGIYTDIKSAIVRTQSLALAAKDIELGKFLYLSRGEEQGGGRINSNILADSFEALIGAVFLDSGFTKAYNFVVKYLFKDRLDTIVEGKSYQSPKSKLQELFQGKYKTTPIYKVIDEVGPEHKRLFMVGVYLTDKKLAEAQGKSKKEAEEEAARKALLKISKL